LLFHFQIQFLNIQGDTDREENCRVNICIILAENYNASEICIYNPADKSVLFIDDSQKHWG